jgi:uncharacterized cupin superfamily protein
VGASSTADRSQKAGHCLVNRGSAVYRYVMIGERNPNEVAVYTDSKKVLVRALGRRALFDLAATRGYWPSARPGRHRMIQPPGYR